MQARRTYILPKKKTNTIRSFKSIVVLSALTLFFYILFTANISTPQPSTRLFQTAIAWQSSLFSPPRIELRHVLRMQSAILGGWLDFETEDFVEGDAILSVPPVNQTEFFVSYPQIDSPTFTPNPQAYRVQERSFTPTSSNGFNYYRDVFIRNSTNFNINVQDFLTQPIPITLQNGKPQVLIIHTHGTEAFFPNELNPYEPSDGKRSHDYNVNIIRVGDELARVLSAHGFDVKHDRTIYDWPSFSGSYSRALKSIESYLERYPNIEIVIDIHRDSITTDVGTIYSAVFEYKNENYAQMMFVAGSNGGGLYFPHWRDTLVFTTHMQQAMIDRAPDSMRPILLRDGRFNLHAAPGSLLLEVGSSGNCLDEAIRSVRLFGDVMAEVLG